MASKLTQNLTEATVVDKTGDRVPIYSAASPSELRYMTPDNLVPDASTTVEGKVELLTDAETITGADTTRAMTASNLTAKMDTDGTLAGNSDTRIPSQKAVKNYGDRALNTLLTRIPLYAPQGFLINGKIVVTDAAGITVAIKTLAGTDPSATDPVYIRIGDTVRTISAALSVAKADGTNWCNAGSAELATKEIDYFVHIGWLAGSSAIDIGFSRRPTQESFSSTSTSENYLANAAGSVASTDYYENVGRFAATLSAGAGYTWSVPTYTAINLIQRPIYETRFLDWAPVYSSGSGTHTTVTTQGAKYKISLDKLFIEFAATVTNKGTAAGNFIATLPFNAISVYQTLAGTETQIAGYALGVFVQSGTPYKIACVKYDQTTVWTNTHVPTISGVLQI